MISRESVSRPKRTPHFNAVQYIHSDETEFLHPTSTSQLAVTLFRDKLDTIKMRGDYDG